MKQGEKQGVNQGAKQGQNKGQNRGKTRAETGAKQGLKWGETGQSKIILGFRVPTKMLQCKVPTTMRGMR